MESTFLQPCRVAQFKKFAQRKGRLQTVNSYVSSAPTIKTPQIGAASLQALADHLNAQGISTARRQGVS